MPKDRPVIGTVWFGHGKRYDLYHNLAMVWKYSAIRVFRDEAIIEYREFDPPDYNQECPVFHRGTRKIGPSKTIAWREKIRGWNEIVQASEGPVLMTDIDVAFFMNPFPDVMKYDFDIGMCGGNTGAVYFSGSAASRDFMSRWLEETEKLYNDPKRYQQLDRVHKGLDQSSMAWLLETGDYQANVANLPRRYHSTCHAYEIPCYLMHYHSRMRSVAAMGSNPSILPHEIRSYADQWRDMLASAQIDPRMDV